jgi:hypothetical protein
MTKTEEEKMTQKTRTHKADHIFFKINTRLKVFVAMFRMKQNGFP